MCSSYLQGWVFFLTWIAYASTYLLRKPLGVVKADLAASMHLTRTELGWLDTALLLPYATLQMIAGSSSDRFGSRKTLGICLLISSLSMVKFGSQQSVYMMAMMLFINGAAQSQAWPSCVKAIGKWFSQAERTSIFGIWGTCTFGGGVMGTMLAVHLQAQYGWQSAFLYPSMIVGFVGCLVLSSLPSPPTNHQILPHNKDEDKQDKEAVQSDSLTWKQLWAIPMLKEVCMSTFCVKIVRYCMYMWLPMYLYQQLHYDKQKAGMLSTSFEIGGVLGSATLGIAINRYFHGRQVLGTAMVILLSAFAFLFFHLTSSWGDYINVTWMLLAGVFNCGVDPILSGSLAAELGERNGYNAQGSVSGIINGFGSLGTVLQGPIVGAIAENYGWPGMLYTMIALSVAGSAAALKGSYARTVTVWEMHPT
ncbi:glucose-6-phosphate exchanger SLC37A2-like [Amphiura filiformis]|uniref:glucose-6-phosphate exchanger SLC37A2-like n=1 Tax=Amphiura filiformis TaxID=82378 RepID=UPI003B227AFB